MNEKITRRQASTKQVLALSAFIILAAQINFDVFTSHFVVSLGILLFPVSIFLFQEIPLLPITFLSGIGVYLSRIIISGIQSGFTLADFFNYFPELIFYLVYGIASHIYFKANNYKLQGRFGFSILFLMDYGANFLELVVRLQSGAFSVRMQLYIIIVALIRTLILLAIIKGLGHYKFTLLRKEHANRYQRLLLLISKLNGEVIWMKKNTALIEETMARSYQLFSQMQQQHMDAGLSSAALNIAKDIHEIKKEYMLILRGISEALDLNLQDGSMNLADILSLLENTLSVAAQQAKKNFTLTIKCTDSLSTDKHYFILSIFRNLFTNALEANEDGDVQVAFIQEENAENYLFTVKDNGPGISAENLPLIFSPGFSTKINFNTGEISRGLGLNLVKDIIENQLSGTICAESIPGETAFYISIPKTQLEVT